MLTPTERNKKWRRKIRERLIYELGGVCVDCGTDEDLQFDHIIPLTEDQHAWRVLIGANARMLLYRREVKEGLLALRCPRCNTRKAKEPKQSTLTFSIPTVNYAQNPF